MNQTGSRKVKYNDYFKIKEYFQDNTKGSIGHKIKKSIVFSKF